MGIDVSVVTSNVALWDFTYLSDPHTHEFVGRMEFFDLEKEKITDKRLKQFVFIDESYNTVLNYKQVCRLQREINIIEQETNFNKKYLEIIKNGIKIILNCNNLYLKFEYV